MSSRVFGLVLSLVVAVVALGCEKPSHANIDKWMKSEKGPAKLKSALRSTSLDADLSAHAGENLLRRGDDVAVREEDVVLAVGLAAGDDDQTVDLPAEK